MPVGEPLSALAASSLRLPFFELFYLLGPWLLPGVAVASILAGYFARGSHYEGPVRLYIRESPKSAVIEGFRVYVFVAGLALVSHQYAALAATMVAGMSSRAFFWVNTVSAILDNATLVALEIHKMPLERARDAIIALLVSGGMLIPGNIPNVVSASALTIRSGAWARVGVPSG